MMGVFFFFVLACAVCPTPTNIKHTLWDRIGATWAVIVILGPVFAVLALLEWLVTGR